MKALTYRAPAANKWQALVFDSTTDASGNSTVRYQYNADGSLNKITSASGTQYSLLYDNLGRTTEIKVGNQSLSTTGYLNNYSSLVSSTKYGNGTVRTNSYDSELRLTGSSVGGVQQTAYTYDKLGRTARYSDLVSGVTTRYNYDFTGRITELYMSDGRSAGYTYDSLNRVSSVKYNLIGKSLKTGYIYGNKNSVNNKVGVVYGITLDGTQKVGYTYDNLNRRSTKKLPTANNFTTEYSFESNPLTGTTTSLVKTVKNGNDTYEYTYDEIGNITSVKLNGSLVESYAYDNLNQLSTVTRGNDVYTYTYDNGGNILSVKKNGTTVKSYTYGDTNWKDKLTGYNGQTITYDNIGNPLQYRPLIVQVKNG